MHDTQTPPGNAQNKLNFAVQLRKLTLHKMAVQKATKKPEIK